ncbi:hypothetical protein BU25DRAFT_25050 [Macroventuria anomochaeta]|uniref:Uncharacterized protein n=1 Tax=Macroventuria anomochaeta TaxID=301207 RepID=A0ACB6S4L5_9PLEO|nr:uncharacterized protein BU25DRAFT_25050 [Macroventuria anomochaeta]KAF2628984.1 hypothetical protein BU25DRAFT_25050 [Macroventuria anomochaeta]
MDTLPRELLDVVLEQLAAYSFPESARFSVLDDASRQGILTARLVGRCFRDSKTLNELFVAVLEETPFTWYRNQMPTLVEVSRSKMASRMTTLSLCGMNLQPWQHDASSDLQSDRPVIAPLPKDLSTVLRRFVHVKHLRYYPISPKCFHKIWPGGVCGLDDGPAPKWGYPPDDVGVHSWLCRQQEPTWICGNTMTDVVEAGLALDSVTFPLFGNRSSYCGVEVAAAYFPPALKRLTISLTDRFHDVALFEPWLRTLESLTFLEIAISRNPESLRPWNSFASCRRLTDTNAPSANYQLSRLEEFRLMSDNQNCFSESDLLVGLDLFPNLRKLGLAHILIKSQLNNAASWNSFVKRLIPRGLERLWLLDPRDVWTDGIQGEPGHYVMEKYWGDDSFRAAAHDVRLVDTKSLWVENQEPPKRRNFDYPGFAIFHQG